jgi:hypothetical protein
LEGRKIIKSIVLFFRTRVRTRPNRIYFGRVGLGQFLFGLFGILILSKELDLDIAFNAIKISDNAKVINIDVK